jgi:hypothetical protein
MLVMFTTLQPFIFFITYEWSQLAKVLTFPANSNITT